MPMQAGTGRTLANKWAKTAALKSHPGIAPHIPHTRLFTEANLRRMLAQYGSVVVKPQRGTGGLGVAKIARSGRGYTVTVGASKRTYRSFAGLLRALRRLRRGRRYLIQRCIPLVTIGGRPIDYRVKIVKEGGAWKIRAIVGRLARKGLFVTNLCRGGTQLPASVGISRSLSPRLAAVKKRQMRSLTYTATAVLEQRYPGIGQLGFDYGLDRSGKIWIFEVNTRPH
jgi:glutathione synthase/RimK-type ligase-like ATP-grasp enzyme